VGIELFERVAESDGRLLRAEQLVDAAAQEVDPARAPAFLLTFDVGLILVAANPAEGTLLLRRVEAASELSAQTVRVDEEEPWWKVIGNPIARAWPGVDGTGATGQGAALYELKVQFREDGENPKVVVFRFERGAVSVHEEEPNG
jgi:hypothetical protein